MLKPYHSALITAETCSLAMLPQCADYESPEALVDQLAQKFSFAAEAAAGTGAESSSSSSLTKQGSYARTA